MTVTLIILSCLLWVASLFFCMSKQLLAPAASYLALLSLSYAGTAGVQVVPINGTILIGWLCMTVVVMIIVMMQPPEISTQTRGTGYITVGALTGMVVGLLGYYVTSSLSLLYGLMVVATIVGAFFGFLLFTNTPRGREVAIPTGRFFRYLLAKGFPVCISVMMIGVALVLLIANNLLA